MMDTHTTKSAPEFGARGFSAGTENHTAKHAEVQKPKSRFRLTPVAELLRTPKPLEWVIQGFLLPESNTHVNGDPASGKSLIVIDWACCVATGTAWHERKVKQGPVVYLAGEGHFGISRRFKSWAIHNDVDLSTAPLGISNTGAALNTPEGLGEALEAIQGFADEYGKPELIIVDTLHRNFQGDENSSQDFGAYQQNLDMLRDEFGSAVVTVHHTGHSDKTRGRGSSSMLAAVDFSFLVEKNEFITMTCNKHKDGPAPQKVGFEITVINLPWYDSEGGRETSVTIAPADIQAVARKGKRMPPGIKLGIVSLHAAIQSDGEDGRVHLERWREQFYTKSTADSGDNKRQAFNRARTNLVEGGAAVVENDAYRFAENLNLAKWGGVADFVHAMGAEAKRDTGHKRDMSGTCHAGQGSESVTDGTFLLENVPCHAPAPTAEASEDDVVELVI